MRTATGTWKTQQKKTVQRLILLQNPTSWLEYGELKVKPAYAYADNLGNQAEQIDFFRPPLSASHWYPLWL